MQWMHFRSSDYDVQKKAKKFSSNHNAKEPTDTIR